MNTEIMVVLITICAAIIFYLGIIVGSIAARKDGKDEPLERAAKRLEGVAVEHDKITALTLIQAAAVVRGSSAND